jgi:acetyl esterase/lipase
MIKRTRWFLLFSILLTACVVNKQGKLVPLLPPPPARQGQGQPQGQQRQPNQQNQQGGGLVKRDQLTPGGLRYRDKVFNEFDVRNEPFLTGLPTWNNQRANLNIEVYTPKGDTENKRACIIFYFGGAWASKMRQGFNVFSSELAMRGYVAINGDYRVGFDKANLVALCAGNPNRDMREAMFRGVQDTKALIRHVRANAEKYGIDPDKIFVAGGSAGGANALGAAYLDDEDMPEWIRKKLGSLDNIGEYQEYSSIPNGVISLAGPFFGEPEQLEKKNIPVYLLQGQCDELIPYGYGKAFPHCKNNPNMPVVMGCPAVFERLKQLGEPVYFDVVCNGGHGSFEWGTIELNRRMANFCFVVMNGKMRTGQGLFYPEKNTCPNRTFPECEKK